MLPYCVSASVNSFEHHAIQLKSTQETFYIICLYRKQEIQVSIFIDEVDILLDYVTNKQAGTTIVLGDFNIHFDVLGRTSSNVTDVFNNYQL